MIRPASLFALVACSFGCASTFDTMNRDPVRVEYIRLPSSDSTERKLSAVALSAEKRNVIVGTQHETGRVLYCAEPPPEVVKTFDVTRLNKLIGSGSLTPEQQIKLESEIESTIDEAVTILAIRTVVIDAYRNFTYALCQFYMDGAMDGTQVTELFSKFTEEVFNTIREEALNKWKESKN